MIPYKTESLINYFSLWYQKTSFSYMNVGYEEKKHLWLQTSFMFSNQSTFPLFSLSASGMTEITLLRCYSLSDGLRYLSCQ